ncbi:UDP-N-acetylglucosamine 2-epimerase [Amycolatopsis acidiphila]|nr:UDP-N-acetylglucosamine 2-epimerase [Amycolatopsis acidiphila]
MADLDRSQKIRVCVFTGTRADYGPMLPVIERLHSDPGIDLSIVASGGHLVPDQGLTVRSIEDDGFTVTDTIDMVLASDSPTGVAKSLGLAVIGMAESLRRIKPDILFVTGDRYEALAAAVAAVTAPITIAHFGGGQLTYGSMDERCRHALTKLSHLHFVFTPDDRSRVLRMGESPEDVQVVGAVGITRATVDRLLDRPSLESALGMHLARNLFLITYHAATVDSAQSVAVLGDLLAALDNFPDVQLVFTAPNVDHGSGAILHLIREYTEKNACRATLIPSLGQRRYLSMLTHSQVVIGNSSSGIVEAPELGTPTVNIGPRQDGRPRGPSIIDCRGGVVDITAAIARAQSMVIDRAASDEVLAAREREIDECVIRKLKTAYLRGSDAKIFYAGESQTQAVQG